MTPEVRDHDGERSAALETSATDADDPAGAPAEPVEAEVVDAELVDEGRSEVDEAARDVNEVTATSGAADRLARVAESLSRVADELSRGGEQIRAVPEPPPAPAKRKPAAKPAKPRPARAKPLAPPAAAEPEPAPEPDPVPEPVPEPDPVPEPVSDPVPEPVSEPVPEPVSEPVPEPVLAAEPEPDVFEPAAAVDIDEVALAEPIVLDDPVLAPADPEPPAPRPEPHSPPPAPPERGPHEPEKELPPHGPRPEPHEPDPEPPAPVPDPEPDRPPIDVPPAPIPEPMPAPAVSAPAPPSWAPSPAPAPRRSFEAPPLEEFVFAENRVHDEPSAPETIRIGAAATVAAPLPPRPEPAGNLSKRKLAALRAFCDALLPAGGDLPLSARETGVAERIDAAVAHLDPDVRRRLEKLIGLVDAAPLASRGRRLSKLAPDAAAAFVERALTARNSVVRQAVSLLKIVAANEFCSTPQVEAAIGFTYSCETSDPVRQAPPLEVIAWPAIDRDHVEECDVVVVGSGAGGSAVAKELAEAGLSVIVVEEGAHFTRTDFAGPPWERVRRMYRANGTTLALGRPPIPVPTGKAVGGTTLVNAGTCFRTPDRVLGAWAAEFGIDGIDAATMTPIFERVERILHVKPVPEEVLGENARVFRRGVKALGLNGAPLLRNISGCRGCGVCAFGCPSDAKQSTHLSYLPRAQRAGATIYARTAVRRVLVDGGRASGIDASILDDRGRAVASLRVKSKVVVLAAGALHTPALLEASALGNRSGHLGRHLRIHPAAGVGAIFEEPVHSWRGTLQSYMVDDWHASDDIMIEVTSAVPGVAAGSLPGAGGKFKNMLARFPHIATAGLFVSDTSQGRVRRRRRGEPLVTYRLGDEDARKMVSGMARIADVFLAAGAKAVFTGLSAIPWVTSKDDADDLREEAIKPSALKPTGFHPVGTARMGADPAASVVDPWGECHDVPGLFVADASMLPGCPTVNPQVTIMAFATRTAAHVLRGRAAYFG